MRVRCVRALIGGESGWLVRWIDYGQPVWRQCVFFRQEADARGLATTLRDTLRQPGVIRPTT